MQHDAALRFLAGLRGGGKSTLLAAMMRTDKRVIVTTPVARDYRRGFIQCNTIGEVKKALQANWRKGFKIAYRMKPSLTDGAKPVYDLHYLCELLEQVQRPYAEDRDNRRIKLVVDEIADAFPHHRPKLPTGERADGFRWAILQGRNWGIDVDCATQRPTLLPPDARDNVDDLFILKVGGDTALKAVASFVGAVHIPAIRSLPKYQYLHFKGGEIIGQRSTKQAPPKGR